MSADPGQTLSSLGPPWNARLVAIVRGQNDTHISTGEDYATATLASLFSLDPSEARKGEGDAFIPSSYHSYDARSHAAQRGEGSFVALCGDVDHGNHPLARIEDMVRGIAGDAAALIFSTAHATPDNKRWRIVIPLDEPMPYEPWHDAQNAFFNYMEYGGVEMDRALDRAGQLIYLPNVPWVHKSSGTALRDRDGKPIFYERSTTGTNAPGLKIEGQLAAGMEAIARKREEDQIERERIRAEAEKRRANRPHSDDAPIMEDFNRSNSLASLFELYGYAQSPRHAEDWRSPHQTGDSYATRIMGEKWVSLSASDAGARLGTAFASGCFGDAYDLFVHYEHGGDHKAAFRTLYQERRAASHGVNDNAPPPLPGDDPGWTEMPEDAEPDDGFVEPTVAEEPPELLPLIDIKRWFGEEPPVRLFAWGDNIPLNTTTMLTGPGGVGKSLFEQMLCTCIALGLPFLGIATRQMNTLYVTCEDDEDELWRRQAGICAALGVSLESLIGKLHLVSLCGVDSTALATFDENEQIVITERWRQLVRTCEEYQIQLYAFDNATDAMAGDLNSIHQVAEFVNLLTGLAIRMGGAAMILHHPNKAGDDWLGSVAWHNKVRARLILKRSDIDEDPDGRVLENPKANYGPSGGTINFRWHKGAFVADSELPEDVAKDMQETIQASADNKLFMACLTERNRQKRAVSESRYGQNYAPKTFEAMPESKRIGKARLEKAMDRLFRLGRIERGFLWVNKGEGKAIYGIREVGSDTSKSSDNLPETYRKAPETPSGNLPETYRKPPISFPETPTPPKGGYPGTAGAHPGPPSGAESGSGGHADT
ncbi:MAG: AAA family ATPase [Novosphingobium sp.]|nr:AAA family ATPase [Novosphingobium sp.]